MIYTYSDNECFYGESLIKGIIMNIIIKVTLVVIVGAFYVDEKIDHLSLEDVHQISHLLSRHGNIIRPASNQGELK